MNNVFIEGLQGTGKSTLQQKLKQYLPNYKVYYEGGLSPVDLTWCSYMDIQDYEKIYNKHVDIQRDLDRFSVRETDKQIVAYRKIITDIKGFHKDMEKYVIYHGNVDFEEFSKIILGRFSKFNEVGNIFEGSFFQNNITTMLLFYKMSKDEIVEFYKEVYEKLKDDNIKLIYLDVEDVEKNIKQARECRVDIHGDEIWFDLLVRYIEQSPHGKEVGLSGIDAVVNHLEIRKDIEKAVINEVLGNNALIVETKNYEMDKILEWCSK